jgi:DNA-binding transcriptional ArsR family regulator
VFEFDQVAFLRERTPSLSPPAKILFFEGARFSNSSTFFLWGGDLVMELEDFFCSRVRVKILGLLYRLGQLNTTDLGKRLGVNYQNTMRHLVLLEKEGVVEHRLSGRVRFFRFTNSMKAQATVRLLKEWD